MNSRHIGDCLDYYKRWFFHELLSLEKIAALPMFTDNLTASDRLLYERLLGVEIIQHQTMPEKRDDRIEYFSPATTQKYSAEDVFLDPDTGLRIPATLPHRRIHEEYFFASELNVLLAAPDSPRMVIIYDQSISRGNELDSGGQKLRELSRLGFHAFAYCAQVAMIGVSNSRNRVEQILRIVRANRCVPQDRFQSTVELE